MGVLCPETTDRLHLGCLEGTAIHYTQHTGSSYPDRSFSITIFCSPAEMLLLPEPGVEARSLLPGSGPLPGVLNAVWTSLRIRGRGPSLDTIFCRDIAQGMCDLLGSCGKLSTIVSVVQNYQGACQKCRLLAPTSQIQQV